MEVPASGEATGTTTPSSAEYADMVAERSAASMTKKHAVILPQDVTPEQRAILDRGFFQIAVLRKDKYFLFLRDDVFPRYHVAALSFTSAYETAIMCIILANTLYQIFVNRKAPDFETVSERVESIFSYLYTADLVIRLFGMGLRSYFADFWNVFDFVIVLFGWLNSHVPGFPNLTALRSLKILRIMSSSPRLPGARVILSAVIKTLPGLFGVILLLLVLLFSFASVGVQIWGGRMSSECGWNDWDPSILANGTLPVLSSSFLAEQDTMKCSLPCSGVDGYCKEQGEIDSSRSATGTRNFGSCRGPNFEKTSMVPVTVDLTTWGDQGAAPATPFQWYDSTHGAFVPVIGVVNATYSQSSSGKILPYRNYSDFWVDPTLGLVQYVDTSSVSTVNLTNTAVFKAATQAIAYSRTVDITGWTSRSVFTTPVWDGKVDVIGKTITWYTDPSGKLTPLRSDLMTVDNKTATVYDIVTLWCDAVNGCASQNTISLANVSVSSFVASSYLSLYHLNATNHLSLSYVQTPGIAVRPFRVQPVWPFQSVATMAGPNSTVVWDFASTRNGLSAVNVSNADGTAYLTSNNRTLTRRYATVLAPREMYCMPASTLDDGQTNFDDMWHGMLVAFTVITTEGWSTVMYSLWASWGIPVLTSLLFCLLLFVGAYFIVELATAVVIDQFGRIHSTNIDRTDRILTAIQRLPHGALIPPPLVDGEETEAHDAWYVMLPDDTEGLRRTFLTDVVDMRRAHRAIAAVHEARHVEAQEAAAIASTNIALRVAAEALEHGISPFEALKQFDVAKAVSELILLKAATESDEKGDHASSAVLPATVAYEESVSALLPVKASASALKDVSLRSAAAGAEKAEQARLRLSIELSASSSQKSGDTVFETLAAFFFAKKHLELPPRAIDLALSQQSKYLVVQSAIRAAITEKTVYNVKFVIVLVQMIILSMDVDGDGPVATLTRNINTYLVLGFSACFAIEVVHQGSRRYFSDLMRIFDAFILACGWLDLFVMAGTSASIVQMRYVLAYMRIFRIFQLIHFWPKLKETFFSLSAALPQAVNALACLGVTLVSFALIGMGLFEERYVGDPNEVSRLNFDNFAQALITVFQVMDNENWNDTMFAHTKITNFYYCLFFLLIIFVGNYIFLNIFIAILMDTLEAEPPGQSRAASLFASKADTGAAERVVLSVTILELRSNMAFILRHANHDDERPPSADADVHANDEKVDTFGPTLRWLAEEVALDDPKEEVKPPGSSWKAKFMAVIRKDKIEVPPPVASEGKENFSIYDDVAAFDADQKVVEDASPQSPSSQSPSLTPKRPAKKAPAARTIFDSSGSAFTGAKIMLPEWLATGAAHPIQVDISAKGSVQVTNPLVEAAPAESFMQRIKSARKIGLSSVFETTNNRVAPSNAVRVVDPYAEYPEQAIFCGSRSSCARVPFLKLYSSKLYQNFFLVVIIIACVNLCLDEPSYQYCKSLDMSTMRMDANCGRIVYLTYCDVVVTALFAFELLVSVAAKGLVLNEGAVLREPWGIIDALVAIVSVVCLLPLSADAQSQLKAVRALRALRAARLFRKIDSLRLVVDALLAAIPRSIESGGVLVVFTYFFALVGVQLMRNGMMMCSDGVTADQATCESGDFPVLGPQCLFLENKQDAYLNCPNSSIPYMAKRVWMPNIWHFDNVGNAVVVVFELITGENWPAVMNAGQDIHSSSDSSNSVNKTFSYAIFYVLIEIMLNQLLAELFAGVVIETYLENAENKGGLGLLTPDQRVWVTNMRAALVTQPQKPFQAPERGGVWRKKLFDFVMSPYYEGISNVLVAANICLMLTAHTNATPEWTRNEELANISFTVLFTVELLVKVAGLGITQFASSWWARLESIIVISSIVSVAANAGMVGTIFRMLRVARAFRLLRLVPAILQLLNALIISLPVLFNVSLVMLVVLFIYSVIGMNLFSGIHYGWLGYMDPNFANFDSFPISFITLFRCSTGENFNGIMHELAVATPLCKEGDNCGSFTSSVLFFVTFFVIMTYIIVNIIVAVVISAFEMCSSSPIDAATGRFRLTETHRQVFLETWLFYDRTLTYYLTESEVVIMLASLPFPLGLHGDPSFYHAVELCKKADEHVNEQLAIKLAQLQAEGRLAERDALAASREEAIRKKTKTCRGEVIPAFQLTAARKAFRKLRLAPVDDVVPPKDESSEKPRNVSDTVYSLVHSVSARMKSNSQPRYHFHATLNAFMERANSAVTGDPHHVLGSAVAARSSGDQPSSLDNLTLSNIIALQRRGKSVAQRRIAAKLAAAESSQASAALLRAPPQSNNRDPSMDSFVQSLNAGK